MLDQLLKQLVTVELADQAAGIVVVGNVGRILGQEITDYLIDGVIPFFAEGAIYGGQNALHFLTTVFRYHKLDGIVIHDGQPPSFELVPLS
jgi:hypothetical protein